MAKRGVKAKSAELHVIAGTDAPARVNSSAPVFDDGELTMPDWLCEDARIEWHRVIPILKKAGILKPAYQSMLALYCQTWGEYIDAARRGVKLPTSHWQQVRTLGEAFYLSPGSASSGNGGGGPKRGGGKFARNGRRPA